jgi:glycosyltransferase involved in cell wall biosynthesis
MRIAIISSLYHPHQVGGAELSAQRIAEGLTVGGHEVLVVTLDPRADVPREEINGVHVARIRLPNVYWPFPSERRSKLLKLAWHAVDSWNPVAAGRVERLLKGFRPEIVQTHNLTGFSTAIWSMIAKMGIPIIHVLHDYYLLCSNSTMTHNGVCFHGPHGWCRHIRSLQRKQSQAVGTVVGVSQFILDTHLSAGVFPKATTRLVINNGCDVPAGLMPIIANRIDRTSTAPLKVGYLGQISEVKGLRPLLMAVAKLPQDQVTLTVAGTGDESYIQQLKQSHPLQNVRFVGRVNPAEFLNQIDLLCVPSIWHDPLPTVVFEAYSHGVPVVGSKMGGITEMVDDGVTGRLVPAGDVAELAAALSEFVDQPASLPQFRRNALIKARQFTKARNIAAYANLHRDWPLTRAA